MATQAAARQAQAGDRLRKPKILRIGIIQGGRIVEERLVRKRENITIGQSAKNMFVVPSEALPRNWLLFEVERQPVRRALLRRDGRPHRRRQRDHLAVAAQADRQDSEAGAPAGCCRSTSGRAERSRSADMTILFQFVTPPPPQPRPQLPASVRGSVADRHRLVLHHHRRDLVPAPPHLRHLPAQRRLAAQAGHRGDPRPLRADGGEEAGGEEGRREEGRGRRRKDEKKPEKKKGDDEEKKAAQEGADRRGEGEAGRGEGQGRRRAPRAPRRAGEVDRPPQAARRARPTASGSIADVLGKGDVDRDQEKAFQGVGGVGVASSNDQLRGIKSGGRGSGRVANVGGLRGGGAHRRRRHRRRRRPRRRSPASSRARRPPSTASSIPAMVAKEVRARLGAIKACYERALKRNPNLSGKVVIHWTITAGRHGVGRRRRAGHARRRRGRELHQVADRALALPGARPAARSTSRSRSSSRPHSRADVEGRSRNRWQGQHLQNRSVSAISAVDTPRRHAYNPCRYYKYLISLKFSW